MTEQLDPVDPLWRRVRDRLLSLTVSGGKDLRSEKILAKPCGPDVCSFII